MTAKLTDDDRAYWDAAVDTVNAARKLLDDKPQRLRIGYSPHPGSILNAYREGDVTFTEAVEAIRTLGDTGFRASGALTSREDRIYLRIHMDGIRETSPPVHTILARLIDAHERIDNP